MAKLEKGDLLAISVKASDGGEMNFGFRGESSALEQAVLHHIQSRFDQIKNGELKVK